MLRVPLHAACSLTSRSGEVTRRHNRVVPAVKTMPAHGCPGRCRKSPLAMTFEGLLLIHNLTARSRAQKGLIGVGMPSFTSSTAMRTAARIGVELVKEGILTPMRPFCAWSPSS